MEETIITPEVVETPVEIVEAPAVPEIVEAPIDVTPEVIEPTI